MAKYDVLLIHPPSIYDFRRKTIFPGPASRSVHETYVFFSFPVGFLSIADYLHRFGYKVKIINLGDFMYSNRNFDVERFLKNSEASIYGIDLHWCVHAQGSIEIAKLCKHYHPDSIVLLGGLTATCFHQEIVREYPFIDLVLRGEAEKPMLKLIESYEKTGDISDSPNISYMDARHSLRMNPLMRVCASLDDFEFTGLDFLEPKGLSLKTKEGTKRWYIPSSRGCTFNCATCGGSAYSYRILHNRVRPAFRGPSKIVEDMNKLAEQGIEQVAIFSDIRLGGPRYWKGLIKALNEERPDTSVLSFELFYPADEEFLRAMKSLYIRPTLVISPESGSYSVRMAHGRKYCTDDLLKTATIAQENGIPLLVHFMIGLANETSQSIGETLSLCKKMLNMSTWAPILPDIGMLIMLDPGSPAFYDPEKYGYRLRFKSFRDYFEAMTSYYIWTDWISYETKYFNRDELASLMLRSLAGLIDIYEKSKIITKELAKYKRFTQVLAEKFLIDNYHDILKERDSETCLAELKQSLRTYELMNPKKGKLGLGQKLHFKLTENITRLLWDSHGYRHQLKKMWKDPHG